MSKAIQELCGKRYISQPKAQCLDEINKYVRMIVARQQWDAGKHRGEEVPSGNPDFYCTNELKSE